MDIEIKVTKSNGQSQSAVSSFSRFSDAYLLMDTVVDIRETAVDGEYVIYIQPVNDIAIRSVELSFEFDHAGAYIYNNGASASDNASVMAADVPLPFSRDVFMAANYDYDTEGKAFVLNLGFTSFERFFTYFTYVPGRVTAVYNLENRLISAGTILRLENIMIDDTFCAGLFLESVSDSITRKQKIKGRDTPVFAWRSGSGSGIDTAEIKALDGLTEGRETCKAILIDGNWQTGGEYSCVLEPDSEAYPDGICAVFQNVNDNGFRAGLTYAPALISDESPKFKDYNYRLYSDRNYIPSFENVYPMNPASQDVQTETFGFVKNAVSNWNTGILKLDHIGALLRRDAASFSPVVYQRDYSVGLLRRFLKGIRNAAGPDTFLLVSDLFGECAGIADGITLSDDHIYEADASNIADGAGTWNAVRAAILNMLYKSFYNYTIYRSFGAELTPSETITDDEFQMLAVTSAFCGGNVLTAGDPEKFNEYRRSIISKILPPGGISVRPLDQMEYPCCTHAFCTVPDKSVRTEIHVLYNYDDFDDTRILKVSEPSVFVDMLSGELISSGRAYVSVNIRPHSAVPVLVKNMPEFPALLWTNENIYCGCVNTSDLFFSDTLIITSDAPKGTEFNIYVPYGRGGDVFVNEKKLRLDLLKVTDLGEGSIFTYVQ